MRRPKLATRSTQTITKEKLPEVTNNMAVLSFGYSKKFVLPYEDGAAIMALLKKAELMETNYSDEPESIMPMKSTDFSMAILAYDLYAECKVKCLIGGDS